MLQLRHPGVYTQEIPSGIRAITGAPTSVTLFVGPTLSGIDLRPIRLQNFGDFQRSFGGVSAASSLSYSVLHFFSNGGNEAWVLRVPAKNAFPAISTLRKEVAALDQSGSAALRAIALSSGKASGNLFLETDRFGLGAAPFDNAGERKRFNLTIRDALTGAVERFINLSMVPTSSRYAETVVNDPATGSNFVSVAVLAPDAEGPQATGSVYKLKAALPNAAFAKDVALKLNVAMVLPNGSADAANAIAGLDVTVFKAGDTPPATVVDLARKLQSAIGMALSASAIDKAKLAGASIAIDPVEGGTFLRVSTTALRAPLPVARASEAVVTLVAPGAGPDSFLDDYFDGAAVVTNPSRFGLGGDFGGTAAIIDTAVVAPATPNIQAGADGDPNGQPDSTKFRDAVNTLSALDPFFNLLSLPDLARPSPGDPKTAFHGNAMAIYSDAAAICEAKFAFLLIDPPPSATTVGAAESWKSLGFTFQSEHSAAFFPNIRVDDPLNAGTILSHPPSGAIAGMIARTDTNVGVWQAPAGTDASLSGVYGPSIVLSDSDHDILNPVGINVIRRFPIYGTVNFGSRTVNGADALASDYKYVPVRRTANYILRSLSEGLRWAVHKPNGEQLWADLRMNVTSFMQGLFRQGAFKGTSPRDAYRVLCDSSTTTAADIDAGVVNIVVGFAPLKPAEFVVISLRQIVQAAS